MDSIVTPFVLAYYNDGWSGKRTFPLYIQMRIPCPFAPSLSEMSHPTTGRTRRLPENAHTLRHDAPDQPLIPWIKPLSVHRSHTVGEKGYCSPSDY